MQNVWVVGRLFIFGIRQLIMEQIQQEQLIRKIIHIDMDAFYALVNQRDIPEYKG